jgi:hypothetical protein
MMKKIRNHLINNYSKEEIKDMAEYGLQGGFSGFIYYSETEAFHDQFEDEIWDLVHGSAQDMGYESSLDFINSFNYSKNVGSMTQLKNVLTWFAVEEASRSLVNGYKF